ncbi:hypothetical protein LSM04_009274 [Trypanosoma melophagium]|uniref:uncharacterized protein n=1 Tax=Trypanosoma melophagium TaxID=715481 RepID=UPI00351A60BF|nr:hypothetical protein LSM04_009274 [Trypanosoma melophagium]
MDMDALTRRQADKIEYVLRDLVRDLEIVACLPLDLTPWTRKACLEAVRNNITANITMNNNNNINNDNISSTAADMTMMDEVEDEERIARLIYDVAGQYGDPTDVDRNEVLLQMTEFAELEKDVLEAATVVGSVEESELSRHHALFRAVLDTLREGGYLEYTHHLNQSQQHSQSQSQSQLQSTQQQQQKEDVVGRSSAAFLLNITDLGVPALQRVVEGLVGLVAARNKTTVNEDIHNYRILHEAVNKEKTTSADVKALKREYQETRDARRAEVAALDAEIRQLEEEIEYTRSVVAMELNAFLDVNNKMEEDRRKQEAEHLEELKEQQRQEEERLAAMVARNQEESNALRTQRGKKEAAVSAAITEYDAQMTTLLAATSALNKEAEEDTELIVGLDKELGVLRTEKGEYELEKYIESMRDRHYEEMEEKAKKHAATIQACFRAYMARVKFLKAQASTRKKRASQKV